MTELEVFTPTNELQVQMDYARAVSSAALLPSAYRDRPADIMLAMGLGQAMGLSPAESMYRIDVIGGKPCASAELIASNVRKAGHKLRMQVTEDPPSATCTIIRGDDPDEPISITRDVAWAQKMGLINKDNYKKQPATMLSWRAISACARLACSEALYGVTYTSDEMYDMPSMTVEQVPTTGLGSVLKQDTPAAEEMAAPPNDSDPDPGPEQPGQSPDAPSPQSGEDESGSESPMSVFNEAEQAFFARLRARFANDAAWLEYATETVGRPIAATNELTADEFAKVIARMDEEDAITKGADK